MKALLLAGGKGTRLAPLTDHLPKPMVPVLGRPLLERLIYYLKQNGINQLVFSLGYQADCIRDYFGYGSRLGVSIEYAIEKEALGTGGAVKNAAAYLDETFIVLNADLLTDLSLEPLFAFHRRRGGSGVIVVNQVTQASQYGLIEFDAKQRIQLFQEKPLLKATGTYFINAGIYVLEPEILVEIAPGKACSIEREIFPQLLQRGYPIYAFKSEAYWMDLGTHQKYLQVQLDILNKQFSSSMLEDSLDQVSQNMSLAVKAEIIEPVYLGTNLSIGDRAQIGPGAIIGDGVQIGADCRVVNSVLWDGVILGKEVHVDNSIILASGEIEAGKRIINSVYTLDESRAIIN